LRIE